MTTAKKSFWAHYGKWLALALTLVALTVVWRFFPVRVV